MARAQAHIAAMAPYALADMTPQADRPLISLAQNEGFRPPSPMTQKQAAEAFALGMLYPDPDWTGLRCALAALHRIMEQGILCGNGSLELIGALARVYSGPDRAVLAPRHAYPFFRTAAQIADARFDTAEENDLTVDIDSLLSAVCADTGLVFIANPGNPTGTRIPKPDLVHLRRELRDDILLVIDEAYGEFADHLCEPCFDMVESGNTAVLRTFSKAYCMAGFRVGWGLFPPVVAAEVRKVLNPNNIAALSQTAALAALNDQSYMRETCDLTAALKDQAVNELRNAGYRVRPSYTNFVLIEFASSEAAEMADQRLRAEGVILRRQSGAGLPHALRMTIGPALSTKKALDYLCRWKRGALS
ncbi:MAG: histidinol-phosphate transaminase [Rhizobiaceae bacterium]